MRPRGCSRTVGSGASGSAVAVALEGTVPLLVEVQALVAPSALGTPRRVAQGLDSSRLALLLAVLERHAGIAFRATATSSSIWSAVCRCASPPSIWRWRRRCFPRPPIARSPSDLAIFGEIGLLGEVRAVSRAAERVREAAALGFGRVALPARDANGSLDLPTTAITTSPICREAPPVGRITTESHRKQRARDANMKASSLGRRNRRFADRRR